MAECLGQVVGVAMVREETDIEYLRAHYNIEAFIYYTHHRLYEHGHLLHFALNPIFQHLTRHFLKVGSVHLFQVLFYKYYIRDRFK